MPQSRQVALGGIVTTVFLLPTLLFWIAFLGVGTDYRSWDVFGFFDRGARFPTLRPGPRYLVTFAATASAILAAVNLKSRRKLFSFLGSLADTAIEVVIFGLSVASLFFVWFVLPWIEGGG